MYTIMNGSVGDRTGSNEADGMTRVTSVLSAYSYGTVSCSRG